MSTVCNCHGMIYLDCPNFKRTRNKNEGVMPDKPPITFKEWSQSWDKEHLGVKPVRWEVWRACEVAMREPLKCGHPRTNLNVLGGSLPKGSPNSLRSDVFCCVCAELDAIREQLATKDAEVAHLEKANTELEEEMQSVANKAAVFIEASATLQRELAAKDAEIEEKILAERSTLLREFYKFLPVELLEQAAKIFGQYSSAAIKEAAHE